MTFAVLAPFVPADDVTWRRKLAGLSIGALCLELAQLAGRALEGDPPRTKLPAVRITLGSGATFEGIVWKMSDDGHLVLDGQQGLHTIALSAVAALTLAPTKLAIDVLTEGRIEAPFDDVPLTLEALARRAEQMSVEVGLQVAIDRELKFDDAMAIGMQHLLRDVHVVIDVIQHDRGPEVFRAMLDSIWLGRAGRAGVFIAQRRLEVRARLEDGRKGRLPREALRRAIEAVL